MALPSQVIPTGPVTTWPGAASETVIRTSDFGVIRSGCVVTVMVGFALTTATDVAAVSLGLVLASPSTSRHAARAHRRERADLERRGAVGERLRRRRTPST